jgi:sugar phosphate isomerase/epimerase
VSTVRFGLSTHLYHADRLDREHLVEIAAHDFEAVEVFATRTHFDYHDREAVSALAEWLEDTRLTLNSLHAPICASLVDGVWGETFSTAVVDEARRRRALAEAEAALSVARTIPYRFLVVHLGVPGTDTAGDNSREAARRSLDDLQRMADAVNVRLALEVIPNPLSSATALVHLIEEELEAPQVGICLDVGHAYLMGDPIEAVETCSGHLVTTHLHDNQGRTDDHLVPFEGSIDWAAALLALQKIGYDGAWMFEVANTGSARAVLERTSRARRRFEEMLNQGLPDGWAAEGG